MERSDWSAPNCGQIESLLQMIKWHLQPCLLVKRTKLPAKDSYSTTQWFHDVYNFNQIHSYRRLHLPRFKSEVNSGKWFRNSSAVVKQHPISASQAYASLRMTLKTATVSVRVDFFSKPLIHKAKIQLPPQDCQSCRMLDHSKKQRCERNYHGMAERKNDRNNQKRVLDFLRVSSYTYNRNTFDLQIRVEETAQRASKKLYCISWGSNTLCSNIYQPELPYSI